MSSPSESKPCDPKAKDAEYQALWQCCDRTSRKAIYFSATDQESKRAVLNEACRELMDKRREQGKVLCGTKVKTMVDLHLQRELNNRILAEARFGHLTSPSPNTMPHHSNPNQVMANSVPMHAASNQYTVLPQEQHPQQTAPEFDFTLHGENNALGQELMYQQTTIRKLINTLRTYDARIRELETRVLQPESKKGFEQEHDRARTMTYVPQPMFYHTSEYPVEGIEGLNGGGGIAYAQQRPLTPSSQTNGNDGDDSHHGIGL